MRRGFKDMPAIQLPAPIVKSVFDHHAKAVVGQLTTNVRRVEMEVLSDWLRIQVLLAPYFLRNNGAQLQVLPNPTLQYVRPVKSGARGRFRTRSLNKSRRHPMVSSRRDG